MKLAIPEFNGRVSPVFDSSRRLLLFEVDGKRVVNTSTIEWADTPRTQRDKRIRSMGVDVLLCGGISHLLAEKIEEEGIVLIPWMSGEIQEMVCAFLDDNLNDPGLVMPGCWNGAHRGKRRECRGKRPSLYK